MEDQTGKSEKSGTKEVKFYHHEIMTLIGT